MERGRHHNRDDIDGGDSVECIVTTIVTNARHGPYFAAAVVDRKNNRLPAKAKFVTCSLRPEYWKEERWPEKGNSVILSDLVEKPAGWRANTGRFKRPGDDRKQETQETGANHHAPHQQQSKE